MLNLPRPQSLVRIENDPVLRETDPPQHLNVKTTLKMQRTRRHHKRDQKIKKLTQPKTKNIFQYLL